jgi:uncharacterized protein (TIGR03437 family)
MGFKLRIACLFLMTTALWADTPPFQCAANATVPPVVRAEGYTEPVSDITLDCTGGTPTPAGQEVPRYNLQLRLNTGITSRDLGLYGSSITEGFAVIDDPKAPSNPNAPQLLCPMPFVGCKGTAPVQYGVNTPNLYLGTLRSSDVIGWDGVAIDSPGSGLHRMVRLTNIRANVNQAWIDAVALNPSLKTIPITGTLTLSPCGDSTGFVETAYQALLLATGTPSFAFGVSATTLYQVGNAPPTGFGGGPANFSVFYTELNPNVFRGRFANSTATNPNAFYLQNVPGSYNFSESGFVPFIPSTISLQPQAIQNLFNSFHVDPGVADSGTLFLMTLEVPPSSNLKFQVLPQFTLTLPNGAAAGTGSISPLGGTVVGNNIVFAPTAGIVNIISEITYATSSEQVKSFKIPITVVSPSNVIPLNIQAVGELAAVQFPQNSFTTSSPNYSWYPIFGHLDNGISLPPTLPYQVVASIVDANQDLPTLQILGGTSPVGSPVGFFQGSGPVAPRIYNVGIVSPYQTPMNVTVTKDPAATWLNATLNSSTTPATVFLSVNPSATPNKYSTTLQVTAQQAPGQTLLVPVTFNDVPTPWLTRFGFTNSASYVAEAVAPGMPFLIGGGEFAPTTFAGLALGADGKLTTNVGNTQVLFDGQPAPLIYSVNIAGTGYVAGVAPFELDGKSQTNVQLVYNGVTSPPVTLFVLDAVPGLLTADTSGGGEGAILNHDFSVNGPHNRELPGNDVFVYGGGGGQTVPAGRTGGVTGVGAPVAAFKLPVKVFLDGAEVTDVSYSGPAPDLVEGYFQVNFRIPATARHGDLPLQIQIGDKLTQPGVTVAVK